MAVVKRSTRTAAIVLAVTAPASADCGGSGRYAPCFDAENLWQRASADHFFGIDRVEPPAKGRAIFGLAAGYSRLPVTVVASSPDPEGRELEVLRDVFDASALANYSPLPGFDVSFALPFVAYQNGSGLSGLSTRGEADLQATTFGDPRLGIGFTPFDPRREGAGFSTFLDLVIPLGNERHFSGESSFTLAPSLSGELRLGRVTVGALARLRLRERTVFAGSDIGPQLEVAAGTGVAILDRDLVWTGVELRALPRLGGDSQTLPSGQTASDSLVPAEWLLSLRTAPWSDEGPVFRAGGGSSLPLSSRTVRDADGRERTEYYAGLTSPSLRLLLTAHYTFAR